MNDVITHAEAGLDHLDKIGLHPNEAIDKFNNFTRNNMKIPFVSYNGENFDNPALTNWANQYNQNINMPANHLDLYKAIQTAYPNPSQLHRQLGRDLTANPYQTGASKLQELRRTLGFDMDAAHSATHDVGSEGLGGVINKVLPTINEHVTSAEVPLKDGFNFHDPALTWSRDKLKTGQQL